jgi:hypothetical protein
MIESGLAVKDVIWGGEAEYATVGTFAMTKVELVRSKITTRATQGALAGCFPIATSQIG